MKEIIEGRISNGQIQGTDTDGNVRNIKTDENGNIKVNIEENESIKEKVLHSGVYEVVESKTIEIEGQMTEILIANYDEENAISLNGVTIGAGIATSVPAYQMSTPITITGTAKVYILVKGVV